MSLFSGPLESQSSQKEYVFSGYSVKKVHFSHLVWQNETGSPPMVVQ